MVLLLKKQFPKRKDVIAMVRKSIIEPDAVRNTTEGVKNLHKVTLNTLISAGKEHTRHQEPDPQLANQL